MALELKYLELGLGWDVVNMLNEESGEELCTKGGPIHKPGVK